MLRSLILASVAVTGFVNAQSDPCSKSITLNTQSDIDSINNCTTLSGNLIIGPGLQTILLPTKLASVQGDFVAVGATGLQSLTAPSINEITGTFNLTSLTVLGTLSFPVLGTVGTIFWQTLPALQSLDFGAEVTEAEQVTITDTQLESLQGINLKTVARFNINNNKFLKDVTVQLTNITDSLAIEFNGAQVSASFPNLTWANNATFRSCGAVSLPNLQVINGSIGFFENSFTDVNTPKLTTVGTSTTGGDITFANNDDLTNVTMPQLTVIGGTLQFVNDSAITAINGFPKLSSVHGSIDISGKFDDAEFPAVKDVRGGFNLQTTAKFDCSNYDKNFQGSIVKGSYVCQGAVEQPGTEGSTPTTTGGSSSSTGGSKNAAGRLSATNSFAAIPALAFFAALFL